MTTVRFEEPTAPQYIYVDPETNQVHVFVPIIGGIDISTDNTCQAATAMQFSLGFSKNHDNLSAKPLHEILLHYQSALERDIRFLLHDNPIKAAKEYRLQQIKEYLTAIQYIRNDSTMQSLKKGLPEYPAPIQTLVDQRSNLFSMVLRPEKLDSLVRFTNPVFSVDREGTQVFYKTLKKGFRNLTIQNKSGYLTPKEALKKYAANILKYDKNPDLEKIRSVLKDELNRLFNIENDFTKAQSRVITKEIIDQEVGYDAETPANTIDYINALVEYCLSEEIEPDPSSLYAKSYPPQHSPFYQKSGSETIKDTLEQTSIRVQFLLGLINIYYYAHHLTQSNFGSIMDANEALCKELTDDIKAALTKGDSVESVVFQFINKHAEKFNLQKKPRDNESKPNEENKPLGKKESKEIEDLFAQLYQTIYGSKHYDDFTILHDMPGHFKTHQAHICISLTDMIKLGYPHLMTSHIEKSKTDNKNMPHRVPHKNKSILTVYQISKEDIHAVTPEKQQALIIESVKTNYIEFLQFCAQSGLDLKALDANNNTLIHLAAQNMTDPTDTILFLRDTAGIDLFQPNKDLRTAMHYLAMHGHTNLFSTLKEHLNDPDHHGNTPAHYAAENGHADLIALLPEDALTQPNHKGLCPVHLAVEKGHANVLQKLKEKNINLNAGLPLLPFAITKSQWDAACFLVIAEEDPTRRWQNFLELSQFTTGARRTNQVHCFRSPWFSTEKLKDIIETGLSIEKLTKQNLWIIPTPHQLGAILPLLGEQSQASLLKIAGKDWLQSQINSLSVLCNVLNTISSPDNKKLLIDLMGQDYLLSMLKSAHPHADKSGKYTAAHYAAEFGYNDLITALPTNTLTQPNEFGLHPAHVAATHGNVNVLQKLRECGVNVNKSTDVGVSPIYYSVIYSHWNTACYLIAKEEDPTNKWRNFIELSQYIFTTYQANRSNCRQSHWFSPENLKSIIEAGISLKKLSYENLWIFQDINQFASVLSHLDETSQAALLEVTKKNWLQMRILSLPQLNDALDKLTSQNNKKLFTQLVGKQYLFALFKSAVQSNDLNQLKRYQNHLDDLHEYKEADTHCTLAHYVIKDRPESYSDKCMILSINNESRNTFKTLMKQHNIQAAYIKTPDKAYYCSNITNQTTEIDEAKFTTATQNMKLNTPLSEEELQQIQHETKHIHMTTKIMLSFLCSRIKVSEKEKETGNSLVHYAANHADMLANIMGILPTHAFLRKNQDGDTPLALAIKQAKTEDATQTCFSILNHVKDRLPKEEGLSLIQDSLDQAITSKNLDLTYLLLIDIKDKQAQWNQFKNIVSHLAEAKQLNTTVTFIAKLTAENLQMMIQSGIEQGITPQMDAKTQNELYKQNLNDVISILINYNIINIHQISHQNNSHHSLLHYAVQNDFTDRTLSVLAHCDFSFKIPEVQQAIRLAAETGNTKAVLFLCQQYGPTIIANDIAAPVYIAAQHKHWDLVEKMLSLFTAMDRVKQEAKLVNLLKPLNDDMTKQLNRIIKNKDIISMGPVDIKKSPFASSGLTLLSPKKLNPLRIPEEKVNKKLTPK
jgi:ankyrin repeat protein